MLATDDDIAVAVLVGLAPGPILDTALTVELAADDETCGPYIGPIAVFTALPIVPGDKELETWLKPAVLTMVLVIVDTNWSNLDGADGAACG